MAILVTCRRLKKTFGIHTLFSNLSLGFDQEDRTALVGPNGSGKSTLLKIIAGLTEHDSGEVIYRRDMRVVYMGQQDLFPQGSSVEDVLYSAVQDETDEIILHTRVRRIMSLAGFSQPDVRVKDLSGGWLKRLSIAGVLVQEPDLLLLDEPTNYLDIKSIMWLENILANAHFAFVMVSHDRRFLEDLCSSVIELNQAYSHGFFRVRGGYDRFIQEREALLSEQQNLEDALANRVRRETAWLRRGPKARTTKARSRIKAAGEFQQELLEVKSRNRMNRRIGISFDSTGRQTRKLIKAREISKSLSGKTLFSDLTIDLEPGKCLGLMGENGCGKSTLMNVLSCRMKPDSGTVIHANGLQYAFFDQKPRQLDNRLTLRQAIAPEGDCVSYQGRMIHVAAWAGRFLFKSDQLDMPVANLSGGEQVRILIAGFMLQPADVLFLDEPTKDLDIDSIEVLEDNLLEFPGAVVLVSHDRAFLDTLATEIIGFDNMGGTDHFADCQQWINVMNGRSAKKPVKTAKRRRNISSAIDTRVKKLSFKEKKELEGMEERILEAEAGLDESRRMTANPEVMNNPQELALWCTRLQERHEYVDILYTRWEELENKTNAEK